MRIVPYVQPADIFYLLILYMMPPNLRKLRTLKDFYSTFITNQIPKSLLRESAVYNLYSIPIRDKGKTMPHYTAETPNSIYQADVLYLPTDGKTGDMFALVVADIKTKIFDMQPMKNLSADDVVNAFKKIFKRKILPEPSLLIQTDPGTEFNNKTTQDYFNSIGVGYRYGKTGRSRQQGVVEAKNKIIAKALFMRMTVNELQTGEKDTDWVEFVPDLVKELNKITKEQPKQKELTEPIISNKTTLLEVGQRVRIQLDKPKDITIGKLMGNFRATDIRWDPKVSTITNVILTPGMPPMYQVEGDVKRAYTYNQLQPVDDGQEKPVYFKGAKYIVEKILDKKGKQYLVKWKGFGDEENRWEDEKNLLKQPDLKDMIEKFNQEKEEDKTLAKKPGAKRVVRFK